MSQGTQAVSEQWIDISIGLHDGMVQWPDNPPVQIGFVMAIDKRWPRNTPRLARCEHLDYRRTQPRFGSSGGI